MHCLVFLAMPCRTLLLSPCLSHLPAYSTILLFLLPGSFYLALPATFTLSSPPLPTIAPPCPLQPAATELRVENNGIPPLPSQQARARQQAPSSSGGLFGRTW